MTAPDRSGAPAGHGTATCLPVRLAACMVPQCTTRQAGRIFERSGGMAPSVSSMQRLMDDLRLAWQDIRAGQEIPTEASSVSVSPAGAGMQPCVEEAGGPETAGDR